MTRVELFVVAWGLVAALSVTYLLTGLINDLANWVLERRQRRVLRVIGVVLFEHDAAAEAVHEEVTDLPKRTLLRVLQNLSIDLDGDAQDRVRQLIRTTGLERFIRRRARARRWRLRVQAAQLCHLVSDPNFDRRTLLEDRHPLVRARAAEVLNTPQAVKHLDVLIPMLSNEHTSVRMAAQQAVLVAGSAAVPHLIEQLAHGAVDADAALEVVANLPDPRFVAPLTKHAESSDSVTRALTAKALGNGASSSVELLHRLLEDPDESVRATAIESLARLDAIMSVNAIGACLSDSSFLVRRAAGVALDQLGAPGRLALRRQLDSDDRFAADMARQVLDSASARLGIDLVPRSDEVLIELGELDAYAVVEPAGGRQVEAYRSDGLVDLSDYTVDAIRSTVHTEANRGLATASASGGSGPLTNQEMTSAMFFAITATEVIDALLAPVADQPMDGSHG